MTNQDDREYRLDVGDFVLGLVCDKTDYAASLAAYFDRPGSDRPTDLSLDLVIVPHTDVPEIPNSLFTTKRITADGFDIADGLITGHLDLATRRGELRVKNILTKGELPRVFEQVLYQVMYSIFDVRRMWSTSRLWAIRNSHEMNFCRCSYLSRLSSTFIQTCWKRSSTRLARWGRCLFRYEYRGRRYRWYSSSKAL